jgi:pimeloyl-ACP methyl ester carboxylesterase
MMQQDVEKREGAFLGLTAVGFHACVYNDWRPALEEDGPPVVCVHGLTRNAGDFDDLAFALASRRGRRVVCPDVVGRGRSDRLPVPALYGYPQYLADAAALLARVDAPQVDWVGTSMGGLIGMLLAAQPKSPIRRLVLNDVGPLVPKAGLERIAAYVGKDPVFEDVAGVEAYLRYVLSGYGDIPGDGWRRLAEHSARPRPEGGYGLAYDPAIAVAFSAQPLADVDLWPVWDKVTCPVLVVRGENSDILTEETLAEMTRRGPKATVVTLPNMGHAPSLMTEEQIGLVERFLSAA